MSLAFVPHKDFWNILALCLVHGFLRIFPLLSPQTSLFVKHTEHHCFKTTIVRIVIQFNFYYEGLSSDMKGLCDYGLYFNNILKKIHFLNTFKVIFFIMSFSFGVYMLISL